MDGILRPRSENPGETFCSLLTSKKNGGILSKPIHYLAHTCWHYQFSQLEKAGFRE
jgi:hypothetical protein